MLQGAALPAEAAEPPRRVVSINVCTDQILLLLAKRQQIAAVTTLAQNSFFSNWADKAADLPTTNGNAESVMRLRPDLVLAGPFSPAPTIAMLRRLRFRLAVVPVANSLADIRRNIRHIGRLIGRTAAAEAQVRRFDARIAAATRGAPTTNRPTLAFYWLGGFSSGSATLAGDVARVAGFRNLADTAGVRSVAALPLERLVARQPDALVLGASRRDAPSLAREMLHHPALRRLVARRPSIVVESRLWVCGTPATARAVELLAALRLRVDRAGRPPRPGR